MKLLYDGFTYERELSTLEVMEREVGGRHGKQHRQHSYPRHIPHLRHQQSMEYRGVAYGSISHGVQSNTISTSSVEEKACSCPIYFPEQPVFTLINEAAKIHWQNIRRSLERRLEVAEASGNKNLVSLLEQESKQLVSV